MLRPQLGFGRGARNDLDAAVALFFYVATEFIRSLILEAAAAALFSDVAAPALYFDLAAAF